MRFTHTLLIVAFTWLQPALSPAQTHDRDTSGDRHAVQAARIAAKLAEISATSSPVPPSSTIPRDVLPTSSRRVRLDGLPIGRNAAKYGDDALPSASGFDRIGRSASGFGDDALVPASGFADDVGRSATGFVDDVGRGAAGAGSLADDGVKAAGKGVRALFGGAAAAGGGAWWSRRKKKAAEAT